MTQRMRGETDKPSRFVQPVVEALEGRRLLAADLVGSTAAESPSLLNSPILLSTDPVPPRPGGVKATAVSSTRIDLIWGNVSWEDGYRIERSTDGSNFTQIFVTADEVTAYSDEGLSPGTRYYYRVRAFSNNSGNGVYSGVFDATTPGSPPLPEQPVPEVPGETILRLNAAGGDFIDSAGNLWKSDRDFVSGGTVSTGAYSVAGTIDDPLYYTRRWGDFSYSLPVGNGEYTVRLHLSEPVMDDDGDRLFNFFIEGTRHLSDYDLHAEAGAKNAIVKSFNVVVTDGVLNLSFAGVVDNAIVSGIEIIGAGGETIVPPPAPDYLTAAVDGSWIVLDWRNVPDEDGYRVERSTNGVDFFHLADTEDERARYTDKTVQAGVTYFYRVRAFNAGGDGAPSAVASVGIAVSPPPTPSDGQSPYHASPFSPGMRIEAEDYDLGGQSVAYSDHSSQNSLGHYRDDGVDIGLADDVDGGYTVGAALAGEWLEYTINVPTSGLYRMEARVASLRGGGAFHFEFDGVQAGSGMTVPNTASWKTFTTIVQDIHLTAGTQVMRVVFDTNGDAGTTGNLNWMRFTPVSAEPEPSPGPEPSQEWTKLFNGQNLDGFSTFIGSTKNHDPRGYFKVENGELRVLDLGNTSDVLEFGYLATNAEYADYHLRFEYKWGEDKYAPRENDKRDSGVMFHLFGADQLWPAMVEFQIQEGDTGDLWVLNNVHVSTTLESINGSPKKYMEGGEAYTFKNSRVAKSRNVEKSADWNIGEIIVTGDDAVFLLNGVVVNRVTDIRVPDPDNPGKLIPLSKGRIAFQAEGAEIAYRNIEIRSLAPAPAPTGATALFNGGGVSQWKPANGSGGIAWPVVDGNLTVKPGSGGIATVNTYRDFKLHLEVNVPPTLASLSEQARGNSGIFLQGRYEIQILDSHQRALQDANDMGAIYGVKNADTNAALPSGAWQSYDITFRAARWNGGVKTEDARVTVHLNGVLIHDDVAIPGSTFTGAAEANSPGSIVLQEHDNAVRFRNIWIQEL